jgi:ketosteroid isomerase-like protein
MPTPRHGCKHFRPGANPQGSDNAQTLAPPTGPQSLVPNPHSPHRMRATRHSIALLIALTTACASPDHSADRQAILRQYATIKAAHFHKDAAAFLSPYDTTWLVVANGAVSTRSHPTAQSQLQAYLDSTTFTEITDLDPPTIEIASDGSIASLLGHVRIRAQHLQPNGTTTPVEFESAFLDIWHKKGGQWRITTHANTQHDSA